MIKFFRKIRYKLMETGKTSKYFKYAIGEIILVVIGILIALQINNWNEERKNRYVEQKILQSINDDLTIDLINIRQMISNDSALNKANRQLMGILNDSLSVHKPTYNALFGNINRYEVFYPQKMGYEALKSKGLEILRNDNLKSEIVNLYDVQYALMAEAMDLKKQLYLDTNLIFNSRLRTVLSDTASTAIGFSFIKIPNNFEALKQDNAFMGNLTHITVEQLNFINYDKSILNKMKLAKAHIEQELNQ
jgi:hypothetical protein